MGEAYDDRAADRPDRRGDRPAPADLGRARRERDDPGRDRPADPPGANLLDGHRYIVAMRNLKNAAGDRRSRRPPGFRLYRDKIPTDIPVIEQRRAHFERALRRRSTAPGSSARTSTWPGTSRSPATRNLSERMLSIRNDALAQLGDTTPGDGVVQGHAPELHDHRRQDADFPATDRPATRGREHPRGHRHLHGPLLPRPDCGCPPRLQVTTSAPTGCRSGIPGNTYAGPLHLQHPALGGHRRRPGPATSTSTTPVRPSMYGHGLFGDYTEVHTGNVRQLGDENDVITCATDWIGMSRTTSARWRSRRCSDLSKFSPLPDRLQQGFLDFIYLGRLLTQPDGLAADPAFKFGGDSALRPDHALLLRQQPGRDRRRRADRGRARRHPLGPLRAGDELLAAAHPQRRLRGLRADPLPVLPGRGLAAAAALADPVDVGPRRAERLRQPHDRPTRCRTRPRTRC